MKMITDRVRMVFFGLFVAVLGLFAPEITRRALECALNGEQ